MTARTYAVIIPIFLLTVLVVFRMLSSRHHTLDTYPAGVIVHEAPEQLPVQSVQTWARNGYDIIPLASFSIRAKILGIQYYRTGREAGLSPVDFALGWGRMSDEKILRHFSITQKDRWSYWRADSIPLSNREILVQSANTHLIPATPEVARTLGTAALHDIITLKGYLVQAQGGDGWTWTSSLSRTDTGAAACEVIWVNSAFVEKHPAPKLSDE